MAGSPRRRRRPASLALIAAAAEDRRDLELARFTELEVDWIIDNGLGPLLCRATSADAERNVCPTWERLLSADLTARVVCNEQIEATLEIVEACRKIAPITLLKGIAIGNHFYPEPHLRLMGDIDLLADKEHVRPVEETLLELGYERRLPHGQRTPNNHHHGVPLWNPEHGN